MLTARNTNASEIVGKNSIQVLHTEKEWLRAFPKSLLFLEGCIMSVRSSMHGWMILPIPCLWGRIPLTVLKDIQICMHPNISHFPHHFSYPH